MNSGGRNLKKGAHPIDLGGGRLTSGPRELCEEGKTVIRYTIPGLLQQPGDNMRKRGSQAGSYRLHVNAAGVGTWYARFSQLQRDETGNVRWKEREVKIRAATAREIEAYRANKTVPKTVVSEAMPLIADANKLTQRPAGLATLSEFVESRYWPQAAAQLKRHTQIQYRSLLDNHILPSLGDLPMAEISTAACQTLLTAKAERYKPETVAHIAKVISAVTRHARRLGFFAGQLPTEDVVLPRKSEVKKRILGRADVEAIARELKPDHAAIVWTLWFTGMRIGELAGLTWEHVNLTAEGVQVPSGEWLPPSCLLVCQSFTAGEWAATKSAAGRRLIPIVPELAALLAAHRARAKFLGATDCVFANRDGNPLDAHNLTNRHLKPAAAKLGIKANFHLLRHSFATRQDGALTPAQHAAVMGHASVRMTGHYTHPDFANFKDKIVQ